LDVLSAALTQSARSQAKTKARTGGKRKRKATSPLDGDVKPTPAKKQRSRGPSKGTVATVQADLAMLQAAERWAPAELKAVAEHLAAMSGMMGVVSTSLIAKQVAEKVRGKSQRQVAKLVGQYFI
jgi:hypothetical protein